MGLTLGVIFAVSSSGNATKINQTAAGAAATPSASASASAAASASPTAAAAAPAVNMSCAVIVPPNPLSAQGLATPWQLTGPNGTNPQGTGCTQANAAVNGTFVQATIINPRTGQLAVYNPLVITQGTTPAAAPVVPALPAGAVVVINVGNNGQNLTLLNTPGTNSIAQGRCVNGLNGSIFGEDSYCNGPRFFQTAFRDIARGRTVIPALGTTNAGLPCPSTRSFALVDQDQSDNVTASYLINGNGQTAQDTAANAAALGATVIKNPSDSLVLNSFVDAATGCTPFTAPDLANNNTPTTSLALSELQAAKDQQAPIALVPLNDPMTLVNNAFSTTKTNLYRQGVGQPPVSNAQVNDTPAGYCMNLVNVQPNFLTKEQTVLANATSPVAAVGNNLFTFLSARLSASFTNLNCANFGLKNPVTLTLDGNGVAIAATLSLTQQTATAANGGGAAMAGAGGTTSGATGNPAPAHHHRHGQKAGGA
ncbi:MAG: hypothetical protein JOY82_19070 [Streptosporangiaceae bacterium]|nr:hypothetical protein [Streptosporangiaceae bacterium]